MIISVLDLLKELILIAEKSAKIARICRAESDQLFKNLIQEKTADSKNPRFLHDYKTFADVLIQQMATFCLENKFAGLASQIYGEETNCFENTLGEQKTIRIHPQKELTFDLLVQILDGNHEFANQLVEIIYMNNENLGCDHIIEQIDDYKLTLQQSDIAIWIDPIDSTSEYIKGYWPASNENNNLEASGLHCVTCLFGVFDVNSGIPILGVLNQPFFKKSGEGLYEGRCFWGFKIGKVCANNIGNISQKSEVILVGGKEAQELKNKLNQIGKPMYIAGAGHKLMNVAIGEAEFLVTSSKSTYFWDTCAAHAILRSFGGGIIPFENYQRLPLADECHDSLQIKYKKKNAEMRNAHCQNAKGMIAYRDVETLDRIVKFLKSC